MKLLNGFYVEETEKSIDELISDICVKYNYELLSKASRDIVYFTNRAGEFIIILKDDLYDYLYAESFDAMKILNSDNRSLPKIKNREKVLNRIIDNICQYANNQSDFDITTEQFTNLLNLSYHFEDLQVVKLFKKIMPVVAKKIGNDKDNELFKTPEWSTWCNKYRKYIM